MSAMVQPIEGQAYYVTSVGGEWGVILLDPASGLFMAHSTYGSYCHIWSSPGEGGLMKLLSRLDYSYAMGKWVGASYGQRFDHEQTVQNVKHMIIGLRKHQTISNRAARDAWSSLDDMDYMYAESDFIHYIMSDHEMRETICGDGWGPDVIPIGRTNDPQCVGFWNNIFIPFVATFVPDHRLEPVT